MPRALTLIAMPAVVALAYGAAFVLARILWLAFGRI